MVKGALVAVTILVVYLSSGQAQKIERGPRGDGTAFKKCGGGLLSSGNDRCYEVLVSKLKVQIGKDGTDDDVRVEICSDATKKKDCCLTDILKTTFKDDWSKNDLETWSTPTLGSCKTKKLLVKQGLTLSLNKTGTDSLSVTSIIVDTTGVTGKKDKKTKKDIAGPLEQFSCGAISFAQGVRTAKGVSCRESPYSYERVKKINVTMGNQGSDDDVLVDICSDVNEKACCREKLSGTFSDDWEKNDVEIWEEKYLGKCETQLYKVRSGLKFGIFTKKRATKALIVNKILVETVNQLGKTSTYDCKSFTMTGKDFVQNTCTRKTGGSFKTSSKKKTTKKPKTTTTKRTTTTTKKKGLIQQGLDLVRGKPKTATTPKPVSTTTTRRPFRSGSGK